MSETFTNYLIFGRKALKASTLSSARYLQLSSSTIDLIKKQLYPLCISPKEQRETEVFLTTFIGEYSSDGMCLSHTKGVYQYLDLHDVETIFLRDSFCVCSERFVTSC